MNAGHCDGTLHFVSEKSLDDLKARVNDESVSVTAYQFKPNFVVTGTEPYEEDTMKEMVIANPATGTSVKLTITKHCMRCKQ